jgi:ribosomal protein S27E
MKIRRCPNCGAVIIKDSSGVRLQASFQSLCKICTKVMLGEDKPEYWTEVR